jgi:hypothetical protein
MNAPKLKSVFAALLILVISSSFTITNPSDMLFRIKDGEVSINNTAIKPSWPFKAYKAVLGPQDRTQGNRVEIYDSYGLLFFRHLKHKKNITEIQIRFSNYDNDEITTNQAFPGTVLVDDVAITKDMSPNKVISKLPNWHKEECSLEHEIKLLYIHTYIYFKFNSEENELTMIAIGRDND